MQRTRVFHVDNQSSNKPQRLHPLRWAVAALSALRFLWKYHLENPIIAQPALRKFRRHPWMAMSESPWMFSCLDMVLDGRMVGLLQVWWHLATSHAQQQPDRCQFFSWWFVHALSMHGGVFFSVFPDYNLIGLTLVFIFLLY